MRYPEQLILPMREDLTRHGVLETRTPEEVDQLLGPNSGTVMMVVNSVWTLMMKPSFLTAPGNLLSR